MKAEMVTTALELPGYRVTANIGIVRGIVVRSRSIFGNIGGALQTLFGGNISVYTNLCERTRTDAYEMMCAHAAANGADAILAMRYDANEIMSGVTEVICYGSAVVVEKASP
ncbi:heavy metal-binding domain-containing protein [uncultured Rhodoblastus sp.]|uniref:YbjQ family protein n=1 Tax=uncultured Rhodoblastus sp. TaxID=543037 RepID=UPI0025FE05B1|nr:heavy metal-binding domain-containing protein [uncultured Rhodoblastus sp.]